MGAYGALGGGGRAGARGKGAKTGRYKGWRQPASAKFSRFEKSKGCRTMSDASEADAAGGPEVALPEEVLLLLRELDEADAAVARLIPSAEEVREQIEAAEKLAQSEVGTPAKTEEVAQKMMRKWQLFVLEHGEAYGLDVTRGLCSASVASVMKELTLLQ